MKQKQPIDEAHRALPLIERILGSSPLASICLIRMRDIPKPKLQELANMGSSSPGNPHHGLRLSCSIFLGYVEVDNC